MKALFTEEDRILRRCARSEVGEQWEDRFSVDDYANGLCSEAQVGRSKYAPDIHAADPLSTDVEWTDDVYAAELAAYRRDPDNYRRSSGSSLNKLIELSERNKAQRQSAAARLADLTATKLRGMTAADTWLKVIVAVQQNVDADTFERILTAWGIRPAELLEMVENGELVGD